MRHFTPERWQQLTPILDEAFELDAGARRAFLDRACAGDAELRADVERLLAADSASRDFLEEPLGAYVEPLVGVVTDGDAAVGVPDDRMVGPFRVISELAEGGMGTVYVAERADGQYEQRVALKLVRRELDAQDGRRRFLTERRILARLSHPNIAQLIDGGILPDGRPWFAMELVDGVPMTKYCTDRQLDIGRRLSLFLSICEAVRYAHQNLVVHRDLKPSNMLVTDDAHVKLLDFGIAKLVADDTREDLIEPVTHTGVRAMTPEYAAPEQIRGDPVSTATDVYALGAVLYELLTGKRAHRFARRSAAEFERVVCNTEPQRPSAVVTRDVQRGLAGDLDTIVLHALEKDPGRRYPSVEAMMDDVRRHLAAMPIRARPGSTSYRLGKFVRRHRIGVVAGVALGLALVAGAGATAWQARARSREAARAEEVTRFVVGLFEVADPAQSGGREITARELLARGRQRVDSALGAQPAVQQELLAVLGTIHRQLGLYPEADSLFARAVDVARRAYGPDDPMVAARLTDRGTTLKALGALAPAESVLREALAIRRRTQLHDGIEVAATMGELANVLSNLGHIEAAESLYRAVLTIDRERLGPDDLGVATDLENLAVLLGEGTGRFKEADSVYREALAIRRVRLSPGHPDVLNVLGNIGANLQSLGRFAEAESLHREVLAGRRLLYPDGRHPDLAYALHSIAGVMEATGRWATAESLAIQALELRRGVLGPDHPMTMATLNNLAIVRYRLGDHAAAESSFREAIALWQTKLGPAHTYTRRASSSLGAVLIERGNYAEAESIFRSVVRRNRDVGDSTVDAGLVLRNLGVLLRRTRRLPEAEQVLSEALGIYRRELPADHPRTAEALTALGQVLTDRGKAAEAEALLREATAIRVAKLPPDDARIQEARVALGVALAALGRRVEADSELVAGCGKAPADVAFDRQRRECAAALRRARQRGDTVP